MHTTVRALQGGIALCLLLVPLVAACGGDDEPSAETPTPSLGEPADQGTPAPTSPGSTGTPGESPPPTEEATATAGADETPMSDALLAVLSAASEALDVPAGDDCVPDDDCIRANDRSEAGLDGDIVPLTYASGAGGGAIVLMARDGSGAWGLWMVTQAPHQLVALPGDLRACRGIPVRDDAAESAGTVDEVLEGTTMTAAGFVLSQPGSLTGQGSGWYRITAPVEGWVSSEAVVTAVSGDCSLIEPNGEDDDPRG